MHEFDFNDLVTTLTYKGPVDDFPSDGNIGDVITVKDNDSIYVNIDGAEWISMDTTANCYITSAPLETKMVLSVCECCGAPLDGNKCEYCGSTYRRIYVD